MEKGGLAFAAHKNIQEQRTLGCKNLFYFTGCLVRCTSSFWAAVQGYIRLKRLEMLEHHLMRQRLKLKNYSNDLAPDEKGVRSIIRQVFKFETKRDKRFVFYTSPLKCGKLFIEGCRKTARR